MRQYFDTQEPNVRRAYYLVSNYVCAAGITEAACEGAVVIDRFWPSTVAYSRGDGLATPSSMPQDLLALLPQWIVPLLLHLEPAERARRVRERSERSKGETVVTEEEKVLEQRPDHRDRVERAYRELTIGGTSLAVINAVGDEAHVCDAVMRTIDGMNNEDILPTQPASRTQHASALALTAGAAVLLLAMRFRALRIT